MLRTTDNSTRSIVKDGFVHFESPNAKWKTPVMEHVGSVRRKLDGMRVFHDLFKLEPWEEAEWPWATHRMSLTPSKEQHDPLFSSCPVALKPGTKFQLMLCYSAEAGRHAHDQWKIEDFRIFDEN